MVDYVGEVWLHQDVAVGGVAEHLHGCSWIWVEINLLSEVEASLSAVLSSLGPCAFQRHGGKNRCTLRSLCEAGAIEEESCDLTKRILRDKLFLFFNEFEQLESF